LAKLPKNEDPNLLVGFVNDDDAGIYRLTEDMALVTTADFITPPVDDPYIYGQIAAANAISDVYAMGGRPVTCLNLAAFPIKKLDVSVLHQIIVGALSKVTESGAVLAGGHTIEDDEPKFGLAVTGLVHPKKYWSNSGAQPGDVLILTKPVGSGVLFNANVKGWVSRKAMEACIVTLTTLNKKAAAIMAEFGIHAATDITGFGLAGHALEMAKGSNVLLEIDVDRVPVMMESLEMYKKGVTTGANRNNRQLVRKSAIFEKDLPRWHEEIVFDPQTSGGLLVSLPESQGATALKALQAGGVEDARLIGRVKEVEGALNLIFK
jgi:selenide,water dikinase